MTQDTVDALADEGTDSSTATNTAATDGSSERSLSRRRVLAATGVATAAGLAGCSGILGGDGGSGGSESFTQEESGSVGENTVDGIEIVGWTSETLDESFQVTATVRNSGNETTGLIDYDFSLALYDDSGSEIPTSGILARSTAGDIGSGETGELRLDITGMDNPDAVSTYEISVTCDTFSDGVYCE